MKPLDKMNKDFGAFYPTGHMVVAFHTQQNANAVLRELQEQGQKHADCMELTARQMIDFAEKNLREAGVIANLGTSLTTVQTFLDVARKGATFLILATPDDAAAKRVTTAIHRVSFVLAERYHNLAIEDVV